MLCTKFEFVRLSREELKREIGNPLIGPWTKRFRQEERKFATHSSDLSAFRFCDYHFLSSWKKLDDSLNENDIQEKNNKESWDFLIDPTALRSWIETFYDPSWSPLSKITMNPFEIEKVFTQY